MPPPDVSAGWPARGRSPELELTFEALFRDVGAGLARSGWTPAGSAAQWRQSFVRPVGVDLLAVAVVARMSVSYPPRWPVQVDVRVGAGHRTAWDLTPLVLPGLFTPMLARSPERLQLTLPNARAGTAAARHATAHVERTAAPFAEEIAAVDRLVERVRADPRPRPDRELPLLLAAAGRHGEARALLAGFGRPEWFTRQLGRWLDAGGPQPPPFDDSRWLWPDPVLSPSRPRRPVRLRARARAARSTMDDLRSRTAGRTGQDLADAVRAELARLGPDVSGLALAFTLARLDQQARPFARVQGSIAAALTATSMITDVVQQIRGRRPEPDWLREPDEPAYTPNGDHTGPVPVELDPAATRRLAEAPPAPTRWRGRITSVLIRIRPESGQLAAYLGGRRVGTVADQDRFARGLRAAAVFDADLSTYGMLTRLAGGIVTLDVWPPA